MYAGRVRQKLLQGRELKKVRVFRVEHKIDGNGPYIEADGSLNWNVGGLHDAHQHSDKHPGPRTDGLDWALYYWHSFGFPHRPASDWWFKNFKQKLHRAGYVVNVYECNEEDVVTSTSRKQCIFEKKKAKLVDTQSVIGYSKYYQTN